MVEDPIHPNTTSFSTFIVPLLTGKPMTRTQRLKFKELPHDLIRLKEGVPAMIDMLHDCGEK